jgi:transcriptional regulator with GAF, ATPase, and Fis domain
VAVNVRLIAAANVDLRQLIEKGMFREDLYFRLMVIPIQTPPLREMPGNIPVLANHFLRQHREQAGRDDLAFSRGALEKLCAYRWPGNIRELQHCILRAVVMTDAEVIQADDVALVGGVCAPFAGDAAPEAPRPLPPGPGPAPPQSPPPPAPASPAAEPTGLNDRQRRAWPRIVERGSVRRQEYQEWCGEAVSTRTAVYDLQNLVRRGLLVQEGRGRSVRYVLPGTGPPPGEGTGRK